MIMALEARTSNRNVYKKIEIHKTQSSISYVPERKTQMSNPQMREKE